MNIIEHNNVVYFYQYEEHMISAVTGRGNMQKMQNASYAVELQEDKEWCSVLKDRSGFFDNRGTIQTKKFVKIVKILMED
jgi:hypothetical protein